MSGLKITELSTEKTLLDNRDLAPPLVLCHDKCGNIPICHEHNHASVTSMPTRVTIFGYEDLNPKGMPQVGVIRRSLKLIGSNKRGDLYPAISWPNEGMFISIWIQCAISTIRLVTGCC